MTRDEMIAAFQQVQDALTALKQGLRDEFNAGQVTNVTPQGYDGLVLRYNGDDYPIPAPVLLYLGIRR